MTLRPAWSAEQDPIVKQTHEQTTQTINIKKHKEESWCCFSPDKQELTNEQHVVLGWTLDEVRPMKLSLGQLKAVKHSLWI